MNETKVQDRRQPEHESLRIMFDRAVIDLTDVLSCYDEEHKRRVFFNYIELGIYSRFSASVKGRLMVKLNIK